MVGISLSVEAGKGAYIPLAHRYAGVPEQLNREMVLERMKAWLEDPDKPKLGQNLKYDSHIFENHGVKLRGIVHDTLLQSYVFESHKPHDMDTMAMRHLGYTTIPFVDVCGKGVNQICFDQVELARATEYAAEDSDITLRLHQAMIGHVDSDKGLDYIYRKIELPTSVVLQKIERNGVLIDADAAGVQSGELACASWNSSSRPTSWPAARSTSVRPSRSARSSSASCSSRHQEDRRPARRRPTKRCCRSWPRTIRCRSAARAPRPVQAEVDLHRQAAEDGQPEHGPRAHQLRAGRGDHGPPGLERSEPAEHPGAHRRRPPHPRSLRGGAGQRDRVGRLFADRAAHHGPHLGRRSDAARLRRRRGHPPRHRRRDLRRRAGRGRERAAPLRQGHQLRPDLRHERLRPGPEPGHRARRRSNYIERYFARFAGVKQYMDETRLQAKARGYVETVFGRRLWLPEINSPNGPRRAGAERAAINAPMQGTAADLIKLAMIAVQDWIENRKSSPPA
jgi:DNA polymerase-1